MIPNLIAAQLPTLANSATVGNPVAQQQQAESLAQLLAQYQQNQANLKRADSLDDRSGYINNSGALGVLASLANRYMGGRIRRKEGDTAKDLAVRIFEAEKAAKQQELMEQAERQAAGERATMTQRRKDAERLGIRGDAANRFELTGDLPSGSSRMTPVWTNQGLMSYDPTTGTYMPAQMAGPGGQQVKIDIDPNTPPNERAAIMGAIQADIAGQDPQAGAIQGATAWAGMPAASGNAPLTPYEKPGSGRDQFVMLSPEEVRAAGLPDGTVAQRNITTNQVHTIRLPSAAATAGGKPLPQGTVDKLTKDASKLFNLQELSGSFNDAFAGNVMGGAVENLAGRLGGERIGVATPGQADWWQQYDRYKNEVRNELFGASLTAGEQAAFEAADITPNMSPAVARKNMTKQAQVIEGALQRKANTWAAQGYNRDAIEAATGLSPQGRSAPQSGQRPALPSGFSWED
jgi:hypothetical protein